MPFKKFALRSVGPPIRQRDQLSGLGIELFSVAEFVSQARADQQLVGRVDAKVATVEHRVHVGAQQQSVVEPVLPASSDRTNVGGLQDRGYVGAADGAAAVVGVQDDGLERTLAKPVRCQPRVAEHRPRPVPGLAEVKLDRGAKDQLRSSAKYGTTEESARS